MGSVSVLCKVMGAKAIEGDWEYKLEGCDPVKMTVKQLMGSDWMVACMIPQGNMMVSMLKKVDGRLRLEKFNCSNKDTAKNGELEADFKAILEKGITNLVREGKILTVTAGGVEKQFSYDDVLKKQEEAKQAKLAEATLAGGSGRFG